MCPCRNFYLSFRDGYQMTRCILHSRMEGSTSNNTSVSLLFLIYDFYFLVEFGVAMVAKTANDLCKMVKYLAWIATPAERWPSAKALL